MTCQNNNSITMPQSLLRDLESLIIDQDENIDVVLTQAFQAGADYELEKVIEWIKDQDWTWTSAQLLQARRPKPPSLAESALSALKQAPEADHPTQVTILDTSTYVLIREALQKLQKIEEVSNAEL